MAFDEYLYCVFYRGSLTANKATTNAPNLASFCARILDDDHYGTSSMEPVSKQREFITISANLWRTCTFWRFDCRCQPS